jgi:hypothetical protein
MPADERPSESGSSAEVKPGRKKPLSEQITMLAGVIGSVVTIALTVSNARTKAQIDAREEELKALEIQLKERSTGIEESKERVDRYKWVLGLFPDLNDTDEKKRNFTVSLIRLALTRSEAEQLFASFQTSSDKQLQSVGQSGITAIQNEPIALLVSQMNASTADLRKSAVATLERDYKSSSQAITLTLRAYEPERIDNLSPSGVINGLYFLSATDPMAWDPQQIELGKQAGLRVEARGAGPQTKDALTVFREFLQKVPATR